MKTFLVSWSSKIEAETATEASVKAQAAMKDPDEWQFNASVEDISDEDIELNTPEEITYCKEMCGNESPCIVDQCEDYKNKFKKE